MTKYDLAPIVVTACILVVMVAFIMLGWTWGTNRMHDEAVKAGKAEYYLDQDNFKQWRWKP